MIPLPPKSPLRPELEPLPVRMHDLSVDRGYPVPWFVEWIVDRDGNRIPEFRAMNMANWARAIKHKLCWVCGKRLGAYLTFPIGPMCGVNRISSEPPSHRECAEWSVRNCPFLSRPNMVRRDMEHSGLQEPAGIMVRRNPGVTLIWVCRDYEIFNAENGYLIRIGDPVDLAFWAEGRPATRAEIDASVSSGLPLLEATCRNSKEKQELVHCLKRFELLLPA